MVKRIPLYKKPWSALSPRQKNIRRRSLDVLTRTKKSSKSLSQISRELGIPPRTVLNNTNAFKKTNNKWIPKKFDKVSRSMVIGNNGKLQSVEVSDSRHARTIGQYNSAVKQYLNSGDSTRLAMFAKRKIKDSDGNLHSFETRLDIVQALYLKIEELEFFEVYAP